MFGVSKGGEGESGWVVERVCDVRCMYARTYLRVEARAGEREAKEYSGRPDRVLAHI